MYLIGIDPSSHITIHTETIRNMKHKHRISKIENDIITLDNGHRFKVDPFGSMKLPFWSPIFDGVEVEGLGVIVKITNLKRNETVKAEELH